MCQLDASERYRCIAERFEAQHGSAAAFDRTMILLNDVVDVRTLPDENILPLRIFPAQEPQRLMTRRVPVERGLARPPRQRCGQCLAEGCLCRRDASIAAAQTYRATIQRSPALWLRSDWQTGISQTAEQPAIWTSLARSPRVQIEIRVNASGESRG